VRLGRPRLPCEHRIKRADPSYPLRLDPAYDSGGHVHLNDSGTERVAAAVPPRLFG
jgi:hypothetical protein